MPDEFKVTSDHDEHLGDGRTVSPGEIVNKVNESDEIDKRLIEDGRLTKRPSQQQPQSSAKKNEKKKEGDE